MPINEEVLLRIRTNWQGDAVRRGIQGLEQQVQNLGRSVRSSLGILLPGIGGLGLVGGLALATREAIKLSAEFQKMQVGMAALLGSYGKVVDAQGRVLTGAERFNHLLKMSAGLMQEVRKEADRTILETRELMEYVQSGLGFALAKGLTPQQAIKLISQIGTAGRTLGLPQGYPIISEIRALLTGEGIARSQIAQALGISAQDLQRQMGEQFLRYMADRLQGFTAAADSFANSFEARWSTFISKIREILIEVGDAILPVLSEFASRATEAIQRWRASGGAQRLQEAIRDIVSAIITISQMIGGLVQWMQENPISFRALIDVIGAGAGWVTGAKIGGKIGSKFGLWGGLIGAAVGAAGGELLQWQYGKIQERNRRVGELRQRIQQMLSAPGDPIQKQQYLFLLIEDHLSRGAITPEDARALRQEILQGARRQAGAPAPGQAPAGLPRFVAAPPRPSMEAQKAAQKAAAQQKMAAEKQRVAEAQASYREWSAQNRLQQALQEAEQAGWTAASIGKVHSALAAWKQAYLQAASVRSAGEPPAIAQVALARAREEIALQEREIQERIQRGQERAQQEKARQWREFVESYRQRILTMGREPLEEQLWMGAMAPFSPLIQFGLEPVAPIYKAVLLRDYEAAIARERERQLQERMKAEQEQIRAEQERRMREAQRRQIQMLAGYGGLWAEAFGAPAVAAGAMRMALGGISPLARMIADAIAQAQIAVRQRWQEFWEAMAEFAADNIRDAFVRMTMDLMENLGRWKDAFKDFARAIRQMIQRAIAEIIYERFIKRAVEQILAQVIGSLSRGKGGGGGQKAGLLGGALAGFSIGGWAGAAIGGLLGAIGIFQHGGTLLPNQIGWVGERGPELVVAGTSAAVLSSQRVADLLSRLQEPRVGTVNVYINSMGDVDMARRVGREVDRALRRVRY